MKKIPYSEWHAEGVRLFGENQLLWRFKCPVCGHEQSIEDFRPYKAQGATVEMVRFNCIGRFSGPKRRAFGGKGAGPCDYTSGGLFDVRKLAIVMPDGTELATFEFGTPTTT